MYTKLRYPKILYFLRQNEKLLFPDFYLLPQNAVVRKVGQRKGERRMCLWAFQKHLEKSTLNLIINERVLGNYMKEMGKKWKGIKLKASEYNRACSLHQRWSSIIQHSRHTRRCTASILKFITQWVSQRDSVKHFLNYANALNSFLD